MIAKKEIGKCQPGTKLKSLEASRTKLHNNLKNRYFSP